MGPQLQKSNRKYTWQDYLNWPDDERWEVINGAPYNMTPSPSFRHQKIAGNFHGILRNKLQGKSCIPLIAPLDVYFDDYNFVQPDVMVVCDEKKIRDKIYGAPDLVIEVLSPATSTKDKREKKALYERYGVKEYIIVYPDELFIERYCLSGEKFKEPDIFGARDVLSLTSIEGIDVPLWEVFDVTPPESA